MKEMDERKKTVLKSIVMEYLKTYAPVGSRKISKRYINLSPATIRNIMTDLEEEELVFQPHKSAGRVPTISGLKYYLRHLMEKERLKEEEMFKIFSLFEKSEIEEIEEILKNVLKVLSDITRHPSIGACPNMKDNIIKEIALLKLREKKLLIILMLEPAMIKKHIMVLSEALSIETLTRIRNYLSSILCGLTVEEAQMRIRREIEDEKNAFNKMIKTALGIGFEVLNMCKDEFYVEGLSKIFVHPGIKDKGVVEKFFHLVEEKFFMTKILETVFKEESLPAVIFGEDLGMEEFKEAGIVASLYRTNKGGKGIVGVLGPVFMDYPRVVPAVELVAKVMSGTVEKMTSPSLNF